MCHCRMSKLEIADLKALLCAAHCQFFMVMPGFTNAAYQASLCEEGERGVSVSKLSGQTASLPISSQAPCHMQVHSLRHVN